MPSFQQRLKTCMRRGNLRVADLARWFGRRHSTLRGWVVDGREPAGTPADVRELFGQLVDLEKRVNETPAGRALRATIGERCEAI